MSRPATATLRKATAASVPDVALRKTARSAAKPGGTGGFDLHDSDDALDGEFSRHNIA